MSQGSQGLLADLFSNFKKKVIQVLDDLGITTGGVYTPPAAGGAYTVVSDEAELATALSNQDPMIFIDTAFSLTSDKNVTVDTEIRVAPGVNFDKDDYSFVVTAAKDFIINIAGAKITYDRQTSSEQPVQLGSGARLFVYGPGEIQNNSDTALRTNNYFATDGEDQHYEKISWTSIPAFRHGVSCAANLVMIDCVMEGNGTSCNECIYYAGKVRIHGLRLEGQFRSTSFPFIERTGSVYEGSWRDVEYNGTTQSKAQMQGYTDGTTLNIFCTVRNVVDKANGSGELYLDANGDVSGCQVTGTVSAGDNHRSFRYGTLLTGDFGRYTDGYVENSFTQPGDDRMFTAVTFKSGATVPSGSDDNIFTACHFGNTIGGGSTETLTINSGANRTIATGCRSDAAISDSGTGSVVANNTVF